MPDRMTTPPAAAPDSAAPALHDVIIFGSGITGLTCAFRLHKAGLSVLVLESAPRVGGSIRSERQDGYLLEIGPNSYRQKPEARRLAEDAGVAGDLIEQPSKDHPRYIYDGTALREVPMDPIAFLKTPLLSLGGKLRLLREPFLTQRPPVEESVADFIRRHMGPEMLEMFVAPFVSGVYAGDPETMSMPAAIPLQYDFAARKGSMVRGFLDYAKEQKRLRHAAGTDKEKRPPSCMCSFREGIQQLPNALAARLGGRVQTGVKIREIRPDERGGHRVHRVDYTDAAGQPQTALGRMAVFATPAYQAAPLVESWNLELAGLLRDIEYLPLVVAHVGIPTESVTFRPRGFGFLAPRKKGLRALGCLWTSAMFPDRAPAGHDLLTIFMGGATDRVVMDLTDSAIENHVRDDMKRAMGWDGRGQFLRISRWDKALPNYAIGYLPRLNRIRDLAAACDPPVRFVGNYLGRISLPDCIKTSGEMAEEIIQRFKSANSL